MKKLMIAAAIVCASAFAHAGYVTWSINNVKDASGNAMYSGVGYLFNNAVVAQDAVAAAITAAFDASGAAGVQSWLNANALGSGEPKTAKTFTGSYVEQAQMSNWSYSTKNVKNSDLGLTDSATVTLYGVIFDNAPIADGTSFYVTSTKEGTLKSGSSTSATNFSIGDQGAASSAPGAWTKLSSGAVPEPTSAMLILLGVAGLALKRRRA